MALDSESRKRQASLIQHPISLKMRMPTTEPFFALLDDNLTPGARSMLYTGLAEVVRLDAGAADHASTARALARIEAAGSEDLFAVGALAYELAPHVDPAFRTHASASPDDPLIAFGLFRECHHLDDDETEAFLQAASAPDDGQAALIGAIRLDTDRDRYVDAITRLREHIAAGDTYQVNYTFRAGFELRTDPLTLYRRLRATQPVAYGACIRLPGLDLLSRSPELFFKKSGDRIVTRPMKGTAPRGRTPEEDQTLRDGLRCDPKNRAENVMIVDLMRNDLGRIAEPGSVGVDALFEVEPFLSVNQMTSTVSARIPPETSLSQIMAALFPCGSITGAPKVRTMEIIRELETSPRGFYTGAIGHVSPDGDMAFNVPIRTITLAGGRAGPDTAGSTEAYPVIGTLGIGSGIVHDSDPHGEYEECLLKGRYLFGLAGDDPDTDRNTGG